MIDGVAELARNRWPNSTEMGGRFDPKWVAEFNRNTQGVPQDYTEALKWYRMAAVQEYASAQNNLSWLYANGWGLPQDYVYAHMWANLAAASGSDVAAQNRDNYSQMMTREQIAEAQRLAREWVASH